MTDHRNEVSVGLSDLTLGCDVVHDQYPAHRCAGNPYIGDPDLVEHRGVAGHCLTLHLALGGQEHLDVVVAETTDHIGPRGEHGGNLEQLFRRRVDRDYLGPSVHEHDGVRDGLDDRGELRLFALDDRVELGRSDGARGLLAVGPQEVSAVLHKCTIGSHHEHPAGARGRSGFQRR